MLAPVDAQNTATPATAKNSDETEAVLRKRIEQLEERLSDMNAIIGTLESLMRKNPSSPAAVPGASAEDLARAYSAGEVGDSSFVLADRVDGMETQIQALASQLEQLTLQLNDVQSQLGSVSADPLLAPGELKPSFNEEPPVGPRSQGGRSPIVGEVNRGREVAGFGAVAVAPVAPGDPRPRKASPAAIESQASSPAAPKSPRQRLANRESPLAKTDYEEAYGHLLRRDYRAAEVGFREFLERYPNDDLSGNAQYWLGESYYVRGQYRKAADNFLKGYTKYKSSLKASDSLLKLAMSLKKLGQSGAACATFAELKSNYPSAPGHIKKKAEAERRRAGC